MTRSLWRPSAWIGSLLVLVPAVLVGMVVVLNQRDEPDRQSAKPDSAEPTLQQVERGAYLARVGNCRSCHTQSGGAEYAGGKGIATPFGVVYGGNLTPDSKTGIGDWNADQFWLALHNGRSRDGRLLYPVFPYPQFTRITRADSDALFAFLRTVPAVEQANRAHALRWPYSAQAALAVWRALFFRPAAYVPRADRSEQWNRGAYLVQGLGHCAACHSPRNAVGALAAAEPLSGGDMPEQGWYAPSLLDTGEAGVADGLAADSVDLLKTGVSTHAVASGPMAEVVFASTQYWSDADLRATATYLQDLRRTPASEEMVPPVSPQVMQRGAGLYKHQCAQCHGEQGQGAPGVYPALAANRAVTMGPATNLIQVLVRGSFAPVTAGNPRPYGMPPFGHTLNNRELADVLSYIRQAWGNRAPEVSELEVLRARDSRH